MPLEVHCSRINLAPGQKTREHEKIGKDSRWPLQVLREAAFTSSSSLKQLDIGSALTTEMKPTLARQCSKTAAQKTSPENGHATGALQDEIISQLHDFRLDCNQETDLRFCASRLRQARADGTVLVAPLPNTLLQPPTDTRRGSAPATRERSGRARAGASRRPRCSELVGGADSPRAAHFEVAALTHECAATCPPGGPV